MYLEHTHTNYKLLQKLLAENKPVWEVIKRTEELNLPGCHVGAGCIAQTIWNYLHGYELSNNINDIDLVYFDNSDLSYEAENKVIKRLQKIFNDFIIPLDIKNQARVHLWYNKHFGYDIKPYGSIYEAVDTWPTTATSIAVKLSSGDLKVYAPFGLDDLFNFVVRPNKAQITEDIYKSKVEKWIKLWPKLTIIPW